MVPAISISHPDYSPSHPLPRSFNTFTILLITPDMFPLQQCLLCSASSVLSNGLGTNPSGSQHIWREFPLVYHACILQLPWWVQLIIYLTKEKNVTQISSLLHFHTSHSFHTGACQIVEQICQCCIVHLFFYTCQDLYEI